MAQMQEMQRWNNQPIAIGEDIRGLDISIENGMDVQAMYNSREVYNPVVQESPNQSPAVRRNQNETDLSIEQRLEEEAVV